MYPLPRNFILRVASTGNRYEMCQKGGREYYIKQILKDGELPPYNPAEFITIGKLEESFFRDGYWIVEMEEEVEEIIPIDYFDSI